MKPLTEWTTEDLQVELTHPRNSGPNGADRRTAALAELLRRERKRCISQCVAERESREAWLEQRAIDACIVRISSLT